MEQAVLLRAPADVAAILRDACRGGSNAPLALSFDDASSSTTDHHDATFELRVGGASLRGIAAHMPAHIDAAKPTATGVVQSTSVSRVLLVQHHADGSPSPSPVVRDPTPGSALLLAPSGITPPLKDAVARQIQPAWRHVSKFAPQEVSEAERVLLELSSSDHARYEHVVEELVDAEAFMSAWFKGGGGEGEGATDNATLVYENGVLVDVYSMDKGAKIKRAGAAAPRLGAAGGGGAGAAAASKAGQKGGPAQPTGPGPKLFIPGSVAASAAAAVAAAAAAAAASGSASASSSAAAASASYGVTAADMAALASAYGDVGEGDLLLGGLDDDDEDEDVVDEDDEDEEDEDEDEDGGRGGDEDEEEEAGGYGGRGRGRGQEEEEASSSAAAARGLYGNGGGGGAATAAGQGGLVGDGGGRRKLEELDGAGEEAAAAAAAVAVSSSSRAAGGRKGGVAGSESEAEMLEEEAEGENEEEEQEDDVVAVDGSSSAPAVAAAPSEHPSVTAARADLEKARSSLSEARGKYESTTITALKARWVPVMNRATQEVERCEKALQEALGKHGGAE